MPSSGSTPTATPTPRPSWTTTVGWSPSWRSQAARPRRTAAARRGRRASSWASLLGAGGTGCYGAGLASFLTNQGEWVVEIDRPKRTGRTQAKSDALDAIRAGREALSRDQLACPPQRGHREALRVLQLTRSGAVKVAADARRVSAEATLSMGGGRDPVDTPTSRGGRRPRRRRRQRPALPGRAARSCLRGLRPAGCIPAPLQQRPAR
jgi:hypothetical protein